MVSVLTKVTQEVAERGLPCRENLPGASGSSASAQTHQPPLQGLQFHRTVAGHEVVRISLRVVLCGRENGGVELHLRVSFEEGPEPKVEAFHMRQTTEQILVWVHGICFYRQHGVRCSELCPSYLVLGCNLLADVYEVLVSCSLVLVDLERVIELSGPQFPHLENEDLGAASSEVSMVVQ